LDSDFNCIFFLLVNEKGWRFQRRDTNNRRGEKN